MIPCRVFSRSFPRLEDIEALITTCRDLKVTDDTLNLIIRLASLPPDLRLATNLKILLGLICYQHINNILNEGLASDERKALSELDLCGMSVRHREVAHGLLNVHERWLMLKKLSEVFRKAKQYKEDKIGDDNIHAEPT